MIKNLDWSRAEHIFAGSAVYLGQFVGAIVVIFLIVSLFNYKEK